MKCTNCGEEMREGQKYCPECGQKSSNFCADCGSRVGEKSTKEKVVKSQANEMTGTYTETEFLARINELAAEDVVTKAAIKYYGTKVMQKELLPILKPGEKILAIANVYKINIDKYAKEFFALTSDRGLEIAKGGGIPGGLLPAKVKECSIAQITGIETKKALIGETLIIKTASSTFKSQLVTKGSADYIKQLIEKQINCGGN